MVEGLSMIRKQYRDIDWMVAYPQQFHSKNPEKLMKMMSESDRKKFPFDVRKINWKECIEDYVYGVRKYLLNQDDSHAALLEGRKRMARYFMLINFQNFIYFVFFFFNYRLKLVDRLTKITAVGVSLLIVAGVVKKFKKEEEK